MRITNLEPQANNPERFNLYVDGHFLLGVNAAIVLQMGLHVEQELSPEQLEQLSSEEAEQQAVDRALNYLSYRPRSREEVRRYLRRKETPSDIIEAALARLDRLDLPRTIQPARLPRPQERVAYERRRPRRRR